MRRVTPSFPHTPSWRAHGYVFPLLNIIIEESDWTENSVRGRKTLLFFLTEELTGWYLHEVKCLHDLDIPSDVAASLMRSDAYRHLELFAVFCVSLRYLRREKRQQNWFYIPIRFYVETIRTAL